MCAGGSLQRAALTAQVTACAWGTASDRPSGLRCLDCAAFGRALELVMRYAGMRRTCACGVRRSGWADRLETHGRMPAQPVPGADSPG